MRIKLPRWETLVKKLKPLFEEAGITSCEVRMEDCTGTYNPTFAHSMKRNRIRTPKEMEEVIVACGSCHMKIEAMGNEPMSVLVREIIRKRKRKVRSTNED